MTSQIQSESLTENLKGALGIINQLAQKAATGGFIYRGEPECYDQVSSSLYRQYTAIGVEHFRAENIQKDMLDRAKKYTNEINDLEILSQVQHYGGKTNLIDFTTDYLIALFFACHGAPGKEGRVILLQRVGAMAAHIQEPRNTANRVIAQKSLFVLPPQGFIEQYDVVKIPDALKQPLLEYLHNCHGIAAETIFNDLYGFI